MSQYETLMARDGHPFSAYIAKPTGQIRGGVVVVQEIFGVTPNVVHACDSYAAEGYLSVAPALFDRIRRDLVLGYSPAEIEQALGYRKQIENAKALLDIAASVAMVRHAGKVAVIGYCWGGLLAWLAACELPIGAAVCYYGGRIADYLEKTPACPTMLHFGERDASIPRSAIDGIRSGFPTGIYHLYNAGHAFANEDRPNNYDADAAALARARTNAFLAQNVG